MEAPKKSRFALREALAAASLFFCLATLSGCAHNKKLEKKVESEIAAEPAPPNDRSIFQTGLEEIRRSPTLTEAQKAQLEDLAKNTSADLSRIRQEERKARALLVKRLVNKQASDEEVNAIKEHILDLDRQGAKKWLSALDKAEKVLGRRDEEDLKFYRPFMMEPGQPREIE